MKSQLRQIERRWREIGPPEYWIIAALLRKMAISQYSMQRITQRRAATRGIAQRFAVRRPSGEAKWR